MHPNPVQPLGSYRDTDDWRLLAKSDLVNLPEVTLEQAAANRAIGRGPTEPRQKFTGLLNLSDAQFDRLRSEGKFPPPLKIGARMVRWRAHTVRQWIESFANEDIAA